MKIKVVKTYINEIGDEMRFVPIENAPGFTHRVIVNRRQVDWLAGNFRPSEKAAEFFFEKCADKISAKREG